jgi:SAM-dependent methyltransferase
MLGAMSRLSRALGWPRLYAWLIQARAIVRHYRDGLIEPGSLTAVRGLPRYLRERRAYARIAGAGRLSRYDDNPQLRDWTATTPYDAHYLHQDAWAARGVHALGPERHVDVGSRVTFVIGLAAFVTVTFVDVRPLDAEVPGVEPLAGSVLALPFADRCVPSLSCLHVAEHVGLGRYGDPLDPLGTRKAAAELERVLAPGGVLWFSLPVGEPRTNFNAHRVHDPAEVPGLFPALELTEFRAVDDAGHFRADLAPADLRGASWSAGLYRFERSS